MHMEYSRDEEELESQSLKGNLTSIDKNCELQTPESSLPNLCSSQHSQSTQLIQNRNGPQCTYFKNYNRANFYCTWPCVQHCSKCLPGSIYL